MFLPGKRLTGAIFAAFALALAACSPAAPVLDPKNPTSVAEAYVRAFNAKDLAAMAPLVDGENRATVEAAIKEGPESEAYKGVFHPDAVAAITAAKGKVEGPRYDGGGPVFKIAEIPNGGAFMIEMKEAADGSWIIGQYRVATKEWFDTMALKPITRSTEEAAAAPMAPADGSAPPAKEPVRPLQSITVQAINALAAPYPGATALGAENGSPEEAVPPDDRQQAESLDPGMWRRAMDYPAYIIQLEFCGEDGTWLLSDFTNRLTQRKITGENQARFLKILSTAASWHEAAFRARDAGNPTHLSQGTCPYATKDEFMRFVDTDWEGKAN